MIWVIGAAVLLGLFPFLAYLFVGLWASWGAKRNGF